jgi:predicted dehydrogenase
LKRIGLMGCGVVAGYGHLPAIAETPGLELVSVYDPNAAQLAAVSARFPHVRCFTDSDAFFNSGIDAVSVTSPAPVHLDNVRLASRYGKHVLCEKPLAMDDAEIEEMIRVMDDAGLMLGTAFCYRFSPVARRIRDLIGEGAIGEPRALRLIYLWDLHGKYEWDESGNRVESPRRVGRMLEGGPMVDCGVHQIDLALWWLSSDVVRQYATAAWVDRENTAPDHVWLHLDHANGAHTMVEMSFAYCHTAREPVNRFVYEIIGTGGLIRYDRDGWRLEVRNESGTYFLPGASEKDFHGMYEAWRDALESGHLGDVPSAEQGLRVTRIARSATAELIAGQAISLSRGGLK